MLDELRGQRCIVLRPHPEGAQLVGDLQGHGAYALHFPTLAIAPVGAPQLPPHPPDAVIFVSPNAVRHGAAVLARLGGARVAAIGQGTAAALSAAGVDRQVVPDSGYTSEALLARDEFAFTAGLDVWIVRGRGGRALLGQTLARRGARVHFVEVYERKLPAHPPELCARVRDLLADGETWVLATSPEAYDNLFRSIGSGEFAYRLLTSSARVAERATEEGQITMLLRAQAPGNLALLDSLLEWVRSEAG